MTTQCFVWISRWVGVLLLIGLALGDIAAGPASVEEIRAEYAMVAEEKLSAFEYPFEVDEVSGKLTLRFREGEIRSATAVFGGEHGWEKISSYYKEGLPFFVLVERGVWKIVGEGKSEDSVLERRYYIVGGELIEALEKSFKGGNKDELKAAAMEAENRSVDVVEAEWEAILKKVRLIVAARNGSHAAKILLP